MERRTVRGTEIRPETGPETARRRRARTARRTLAALAACGAVAGGGWALLASQRQPEHPAAAPAAGALAAVSAGAPASLSGLTALIDDRERLVRAHPRDAGAWAVLGAAYVERGRRTADARNYPKAERALRTSLRLRATGNGAALDGMTALAVARRDFRAARAWGEQALKREPGRWTAYPPLIDAYTGLGDHKAVQRTLDRLLKLHQGPAAKARAAGVYWDLGRREDAAAQLSDAAAAATAPAERAEYLEQAGRIAWERGDREDALRHFEAAVRLDPDQWAARVGQGRALAALGRDVDAVKAYRRALAHRPCPEYALELGELYQALGLGPQARTQYDLLRTRVRQDAAEGVDDELVLGRFEADHGYARSAVLRLRGEWQRQPGTAVADALGWALHRAGQDEEALKFAAAATDAVKGGGVRDALYAYHRGMIERALDLSGPARRHLELALRTNPYFSPLWVPSARTALADLGEPPAEETPPPSAGEPAPRSADAPSPPPAEEPSPPSGAGPSQGPAEAPAPPPTEAPAPGEGPPPSVPGPSR
ncbi:tetratricopeptide repeat protein [Streptomyces sp. NPDC096152]|uniref:tetratricopeptide repeat protein n=1 Tax=Streptomyces sp. NPDC096152 TaxID=3366078 RepID=UPI00380B6A74